MAAVDAWQPESQVVMLKVRQVVGEENDTDSDGCSWIILVISPAEKYMVSDRLASVHQSLQRRRCDVGCRCASRSSSCRAYSPRLKSAAPKCCDSPSRVSTPRPSFPLLFAQSNFSVSCELPPGQERAVADCVLVDPVLLHLVPNRHLQQPSGGRRSSVSRGGRPTALGAAETASCNSSRTAAESRPSFAH